MTYNQIAAMRESAGLNRRVAACAAQEGYLDPQTWTWQHAWDWAATPGWDAKWASAVASGDADPGVNEAAITDADILTRVQQIGDDPEPLPGPTP
jgi:hypothetical protein